MYLREDVAPIVRRWPHDLAVHVGEACEQRQARRPNRERKNDPSARVQENVDRITVDIRV